MNRIASKWGVANPSKYKKKSSLAIAMKLLMHYRYGDLKLKSQIDRVAKIVGILPSHYKSKSGLKRAVNKRMRGMKMRAGSYFAAELKRGLAQNMKTPLLSGGQGKFLTMRKSSYLSGGKSSRKRTKGGSSQGRFLMRGGSMDKVLKLQSKRNDLEKKLQKARSKDKEALRKKINGINGIIQRLQKGGNGNIKKIKQLQKKRETLEKQLTKARSKDHEEIRKKLQGINGLLQRMRGGSCGSCGTGKYKPTRGGAPLDYSMKMARVPGAVRPGHNGGNLLKKMTSKKALAAATGAAVGTVLASKIAGKKRRKSRKKRSRKKRGGGLVSTLRANKGAIGAAVGAAVGVALVGGKKRKSRRKSKKSRKKRSRRKR